MPAAPAAGTAAADEAGADASAAVPPTPASGIPVDAGTGSAHAPRAAPQRPAGEPDPGPGAGWRRWLDSPPGRYLLAWEQAQLDVAVADVFGYHALQCGEPAIDALRANRMPHRFAALMPDDPLPVDPARTALRMEHAEELPFDTQSLDLVVLPHVLEFAQDPHQVLREVDRVLRPEGRLIVTGFNPVSLWGLRHLLPAGVVAPFVPRAGHLIGVPRLRDWCKLLSFDTERARYGCWRPPCRTQLWLDRTRFLERAGDRWWPICGAVYLVAATKRVHGMRLVGKVWKRPVAARAIGVPAAQREPLPPGRR